MSLSVIEAINPFTQTHGATEILPGSDTWDQRNIDAFMGHVTASHPLKTLEEGWVAPVVQDDQI